MTQTQMNNNDSLILLLKKALQFYSNEKNYEQLNNGKSYVELDGGEQARFVLKQVEDLDNLSKSFEDEFDGNTFNNTLNHFLTDNDQNLMKKINDIVSKYDQNK